MIAAYLHDPGQGCPFLSVGLGHDYFWFWREDDTSAPDGVSP
jgi:hypothetical protein